MKDLKLNSHQTRNSHRYVLYSPTLADYCAVSRYENQSTYRANHYDHVPGCINHGRNSAEEKCFHWEAFGQVGQRGNIVKLSPHRILCPSIPNISNRTHLYSLLIKSVPISFKKFINCTRIRSKLPAWRFIIRRTSYNDNYAFNALEDMLAIYMKKRAPIHLSCMSSTKFIRRKTCCTSVTRTFFYDNSSNCMITNGSCLPEAHYETEIQLQWRHIIGNGVLFIYDPYVNKLLNLCDQFKTSSLR